VKKILLFFGLLIFFAFTPRFAFAEVIHSFDTQIVAHKDGSMDLAETINYDFESSSRHGIYRYIPLYSSVGNLYRIIQIKNIFVQMDGTDEKFTTSNDAKKLNIKIGDPNILISGSHIYKIYYTILNGIGSNFSDHDEIYWNITGNGWDVPIEKSSGVIKTDFGINTKQTICFTGAYQSTLKDCTAKNGIAYSNNILGIGEGLTVAVSFPVNTFPKSILSKSQPQTFSNWLFSLIVDNYLYIYLFVNLVLPVVLLIWYLRHKNKRRFGKPVVSFEIPKDEKGNPIKPAVAGTIDSAKLDRDDVTATIFHLAIRKYIKIEEKDTKNKMLGVFDTTDKKQTIKKLKEKDENLSVYEKTLMTRLFKDGDSIVVSELSKDFYETFQDMDDNIFTELVKNKLYVKNPKTQKGLLLGLGIFAILLYLNLPLGITLLFLSRKLNGRTQLGDEMDYQVDCLKIFLKAMDRNYKWQANKLYVVEEMIPYAIALGLINEFMSALEKMEIDYKPTWYTGYSGHFYVGYAALFVATNSSITTSAPSSSSGFSGGGFSGGGGGGGGGGSW
jgi:hypothetical protein